MHLRVENRTKCQGNCVRNSLILWPDSETGKTRALGLNRLRSACPIGVVAAAIYPPTFRMLGQEVSIHTPATWDPWRVKWGLHPQGRQTLSFSVGRHIVGFVLQMEDYECSSLDARALQLAPW